MTEPDNWINGGATWYLPEIPQRRNRVKEIAVTLLLVIAVIVAFSFAVFMATLL